MLDLSKTIIPKSDQLNADDLIVGPRTILITDVRGCDNADQPIAIHFQGDGGKPYKPCKSMRRVMVHVWKEDGHAYVGQRMTLFADPDVVFGGIKVGGIRISHMSGIDREMTVPLMVTRGQRKPYTIKPLREDRAQRGAAPQQRREAAFRSEDDQGAGGANNPAADAQGTRAATLADRVNAVKAAMAKVADEQSLDAIWNRCAGLRKELEAKDPEGLLLDLTDARDAMANALEAAGADAR